MLFRGESSLSRRKKNPWKAATGVPPELKLDGFRKVIINLAHNLNSQPHFFRFYHRRLRKAVERDVVKIADILFDYGFTTEKISPSTQTSFDAVYLEEILNDHLLTKLEKSASRIKRTKPDFPAYLSALLAES